MSGCTRCPLPCGILRDDPRVLDGGWSSWRGGQRLGSASVASTSPAWVRSLGTRVRVQTTSGGGMGVVRAKKSGGEGGAGDQQPQEGASSPRRLMDTRQMGLKKQIRLVKLVREMEERQSAPEGFRQKKLERSRYRKDKPEDAEAARELRRLKKVPLMAQHLYGADGQRNPPVLLVDGYNVVGAWPKLAKKRDKDQLVVARDLLVDELTEYASIREIRVVVVFDAGGGASSGKDVSELTGQGVEVVFAGEQDADTWVERQCYLLEERAGAGGPPAVFVATSDTAQGNIAKGLGAYVWPSKMLIQEVKRAKDEAAESFTKAKQVVRVVDRVDQSTSERLRELRASLPSADLTQIRKMPKDMEGKRVQSVSTYSSKDPTHMTLRIGDIILVTDDKTGGTFWKGLNETRRQQHYDTGRDLFFPVDLTVRRAQND